MSIGGDTLQDQKQQDFEDINLEIVINSDLQDNHLSPQLTESVLPDRDVSASGRQSTKGSSKNSVIEHYKQFYGGSEDDG